jgi:hypothetical protein
MYIYLFITLRAPSYIWGSRLIGVKYSSPDVSQLTGIHWIQGDEKINIRMSRQEFEKTAAGPI